VMVMPANNSSSVVHYWAGKYPGRIGWLVGPTAIPKTKLRPWMPFALDNDAFGAWVSGNPWNEEAWLGMLQKVKMSGMSPRWMLLPDVVADREATLSKWERYESTGLKFGWPLAFAVQNGMTPADLPERAEVIFIGGTTEWKWQTLPEWCATGRRIHVGRVNALDKLLTCERMGVESVDGTGWMKDTMASGKARDLAKWIEGRASEHPELNLFS
jgi:hypothetical protein